MFPSVEDFRRAVQDQGLWEEVRNPAVGLTLRDLLMQAMNQGKPP